MFVVRSLRESGEHGYISWIRDSRTFRNFEYEHDVPVLNLRFFDPGGTVDNSPGF
jgi:hypothetical protein